MNVFKRYDGTGHVALGILLMAPFVAIGHPWIGYIAQCYWWASRELRDYQINARLDPHDIGDVVKSFAFWRWSRMDIWAPVIVNGLLIFAWVHRDLILALAK